MSVGDPIRAPQESIPIVEPVPGPLEMPDEEPAVEPVPDCEPVPA